MNIVRSFGAELWKEWRKDETPRHAAAIAYYTVFSLPAVLLIVLSVASAMLGEAAVSAEFFGTLRAFLGDRTADLLEHTLDGIRESRAGGTWAAYAGAVLLIVAATGVIRELQISLNKIIGAKPKKKSFRRHVFDYLLFLALLLVTAIVLIASIGFGAIIGMVGERAEVFFTVPVEVLGVIHNAVTYVALTLMMCVLYLFLPAKRFHPVIVLLCSVIVSSLLVIGTAAASYYVSKAGLGQAYGVAANVLILLFWIYFGAIVFLFGAELMEVSDRLHKASRKSRSRLGRLLRI